MSEDQQMTFDDLKRRKKSGTTLCEWHRRGTTYAWPFHLLGQTHYLYIDRVRTREKTWKLWLGEERPLTEGAFLFKAKNLEIAQEAALYFFAQSLGAMLLYLHEGERVFFEEIIPILEKQEAEWAKRGMPSGQS